MWVPGNRWVWFFVLVYILIFQANLAEFERFWMRQVKNRKADHILNTLSYQFMNISFFSLLSTYLSWGNVQCQYIPSGYIEYFCGYLNKNSHTGSYIWTLNHHGVELFERVRQIMRCVLVRKACHWERALQFQKCMLSQVCLSVCLSVSLFLSLCLSVSVCLCVYLSLPLSLSICLSLHCFSLMFQIPVFLNYILTYWSLALLWSTLSFQIVAYFSRLDLCFVRVQEIATYSDTSLSQVLIIDQYTFQARVKIEIFDPGKSSEPVFYGKKNQQTAAFATYLYLNKAAQSHI